MKLHITLDEQAILESQGVQDALEELASDIAREANATSAEIGITWNRTSPTTILLGPRGAKAIPVEFGTYKTPAKRTFKRAIDRRRLR